MDVLLPRGHTCLCNGCADKQEKNSHVSL